MCPPLTWTASSESVSFEDLSHLYEVAPLGRKTPDELRTVFSNSKFQLFALSNRDLVAAGRVLADGLDCAYIADIAVHPDFQGRGVGTKMLEELVDLASGHKKIILYSVPGAEQFYKKIGFLKMETAFAIWRNPLPALRSGILSES